MTDFTGTKYKLEGFNLHQKNGLVEVFAKFCSVTDDAADGVKLEVNSIALVDLQEERSAAEPSPPIFSRSAVSRTAADTLAGLPKLKLPSGPFVSVDDVIVLLQAKSTVSNGMGTLRLPGPQNEELLEDLGAEKLGLLLVEMGKARANYLAGTEAFIPLAKLDKL